MEIFDGDLTPPEMELKIPVISVTVDYLMRVRGMILVTSLEWLKTNVELAMEDEELKEGFGK